MKIFLFLILLSLLSCKEDKTAIDYAVCDVSNPITELSWLKDLIREAKNKHEENFTTVTLIYVNGKPVFNYYVSYWSCLGCVNYACDGTKLDISKFSAAESREFCENLLGTSGKKQVIWPE